MSMNENSRSVRVSANGPYATVEVDGADLSAAVQAYTIRHEYGSVPLLLLHATPGADPLVFEGLAQVQVAVEETAGMGAAEFLAGIDPDALARAAMQRDDLDGGPNELTRAALRQLLDWSQGRV